MFTSRPLCLAAAMLTGSLVAGISINTPSEAAIKGGEITATWATVDTDPKEFSLYLWNFVYWPPYYEPLAFGLDASAGQATIRIPCHVNSEDGYQLTAINNTNVYVLYAQSGKFNITGDSCTDPATTSSCAPKSTVTVTETVDAMATVDSATLETSTVSATITPTVIVPAVSSGTVVSKATVSQSTVSKTTTVAQVTGSGSAYDVLFGNN